MTTSEKPLEVALTYHYPVSDPNCISDFYTADLSVNGKIVLNLADELNDKPTVLFAGFVAGLEFLGHRVYVTRRHIADFKE
jgi:hypothetical protein